MLQFASLAFELKRKKKKIFKKNYEFPPQMVFFLGVEGGLTNMEPSAGVKNCPHSRPYMLVLKKPKYHSSKFKKKSKIILIFDWLVDSKRSRVHC